MDVSDPRVFKVIDPRVFKVPDPVVFEVPDPVVFDVPNPVVFDVPLNNSMDFLYVSVGVFVELDCNIGDTEGDLCFMIL